MRSDSKVSTPSGVRAASFRWRMSALLIAVVAASFGGGCASNPADPDPLKPVNRFIYNVNDGIDRVALKPAADAYVKVIPKPIRSGLGNGFDNLVYFDVVFNDFLQAKWSQGLGDAGRMATNSTIGIAGIFDVATGWGMPVHANDFGITLGKWGVESGPYIVLPLFGPCTLRDVAGYGVEYAATPTTYLYLPWAVSIPLDTVDVIDLRSRADMLARFRNDTALDPYIFTRDAYLQYRYSRIHENKGAAPDQGLYDVDSDSGPATMPATTRSR